MSNTTTYIEFPRHSSLTTPAKSGAVPCTRCGGEGFYHTYGTCFRCGGYRTDPTERRWLFPKTWTEEQCKEWDDKRLAKNERANETRRARKLSAAEKALAEFLAELDDETAARIQEIQALPYDEQHEIASDILFKLTRYGSISDAQLHLVIKVQAEQDERNSAPEEVDERPELTEGRYTLVGKLFSLKTVDNPYDYYGGTILKMLVELDDGNRVYGTMPSALYAELGERVQFDAAVTRSPDDEHFGWFKRPTKASVVSAEEETS